LIRGLCLILVPLLVGCGSAQLPPTASATAPSSIGIDIPANELPPDTQCYVEHGFKIVGILQGAAGEPPGYKLEAPMSDEEAAAVAKECDKLEPDAPEKTDEEIREIYDRWVGERECLVSLGYSPAEPPSFETFLEDYRHGPSGPWMPIDGVDTGVWSDSEYQTAKSRCTLEMFGR
jgi:hypothetical protein